MSCCSPCGACRRVADRAAPRIAISLAVFAAVLWFIDVGAFSASLLAAHAGWLLVALVFSILTLYLSARVLASICGHTIRAAAILRVNLISVYAGLFVPSDLAAGLFSRIRYLELSSWQEVVHRTIGEKLIGLACVGLLTTAAYSLSTFRAALGWGAVAVPLATSGCALIGLAMVRDPRMALRVPLAGRLLERLAPPDGWSSFQFGAPAFGWSLMAQLSLAVVPYAVLRALEIPMNFADAIAMGFLLTVIQFVPFFFAGIGIRDLSAVGLLGTIGIAAEQAIAYSMLVLGIVLVLGLLGGILQIRREGARS